MAINLNNNNQLQDQSYLNSGQQPNQDTPRQRGSGYTNTQNYVNANQGNKLGQTIGTAIGQTAQEEQNQTKAAQDKFNTDIGKSVQDIKSGQNIYNQLGNVNFATDSNNSSNILTDLGTDENAAAVQDLGQGYQGPTGLNNAERLSNQASDLKQTAGGLTSYAGRQAALQRFIGGPQYTQGQQTLDNLLLGQNDQPLRDARRQSNVASANALNAIGSAQSMGSNTGAQYGQVASDVNTGITNTAGNFSGTMDTRATNLSADAQQYLSTVRDKLAAGQISQDDYDKINTALNLNYNQYNKNMADLNVAPGYNNSSFIYNPEELSFANPNATAPGTVSTMDPDAAANQAAVLFNLTGQQLGTQLSANTDYTRSNVTNQNELAARNALLKLASKNEDDLGVQLDEDKVGTAGPALLGNQSGLQTMLNQQRDQLETDARNSASGQLGYAISNTPQALGGLASNQVYNRDYAANNGAYNPLTGGVASANDLQALYEKGKYDDRTGTYTPFASLQDAWNYNAGNQQSLDPNASNYYYADNPQLANVPGDPYGFQQSYNRDYDANGLARDSMPSTVKVQTDAANQAIQNALTTGGRFRTLKDLITPS